MSALLTNREGPLLELTLNRTERRNALSRSLIAALDAALRSAAADAAVGAVILTGTPPAFCAGLDFDEVLGGDEGQPHDARPLRDLLALIETAPCPIIAAVNGPAAAGGAGLVCCADLAVFGRSATLGYPGVQRGLVAPVIMPSLLRLVGERRARYLLLTGEPLSAEQALAWGLASEVVPDADVLPRARSLAARFATRTRAAVAATKRWLARLTPGAAPLADAAAVVFRPAGAG